MKFKFIFFNEILIFFFYKTALLWAVQKENIEIIKLLLTNEKLDINSIYILNIFIFL